MRGIFFKKDKFLESLDLENKIKDFLAGFEIIFKEQILDELFIIEYKDNVITPLYYYCGFKNYENSSEKCGKEIIEEIKIREMEEFDFFIKNVISRLCILNNEGIIAKEQTGSLFDAVFRMDNYYIGLNNTKYSFDELRDNLGLEEDVFIKIVKNFYSELKKI